TVYFAVDIMVAVYKADIPHFCSGLNALRRAAHGQVFDRHHGITVLQDIAIAVFYHKFISRFCLFIWVPFVRTFGAHQQGIHLVSKCGFALGAWRKLAHSLIDIRLQRYETGCGSERGCAAEEGMMGEKTNNITLL